MHLDVADSDLDGERVAPYHAYSWAGAVSRSRDLVPSRWASEPLIFQRWIVRSASDDPLKSY